MKRVLVTGGTGGLGRELVNQLRKAGNTVRVMSRQSKPSRLWTDMEVEWAQADLATGVGVPAAVADVDTIIHAATNNPITPQGINLGGVLDTGGSVDVGGTRLLLEHARAASVAHFIYVSIVGIERVPFSYYQNKLRAEALVEETGVSWSILRATQFHTLLGNLLNAMARWPALVLTTDFRFQPVDSREVADRLCACVVAGPAGRLPDYGGPKVQTLGELAQIWLEVHKDRRRVVHVPTLGKVASAFRQAALTCPDAKQGKVTWEEWVRTFVEEKS